MKNVLPVLFIHGFLLCFFLGGCNKEKTQSKSEYAARNLMLEKKHELTGNKLSPPGIPHSYMPSEKESKEYQDGFRDGWNVAFTGNLAQGYMFEKEYKRGLKDGEKWGKVYLMTLEREVYWVRGPINTCPGGNEKETYMQQFKEMHEKEIQDKNQTENRADTK